MIHNLKNKKVLITAGPTREYLDPVRYISNESSGKMGYAIAEELYKLGAIVTLVTGPVHIQSNIPKDHVIHVLTATEMYEVCQAFFSHSDIVIFSAAVADYRPQFVSGNKIKKTDEVFTIDLVKNMDIALAFSKVKTPDQIAIGFALETHAQIENAQKKLSAKNFDVIIINSPGQGEGFGYDTNKISMLRKNGQIMHYPLKTKQEVAVDIVSELSDILNSRPLYPEKISWESNYEDQ
jgi:phosphopantothenoylcysteine decarboxylase/phosphopantothenate--cysteine ligase